MTQLTRRQKLLGGAFAIVGVAWALDMLTGGQTPPPANAATGGLTQVANAPVVLDDAEIEAAIASLEADGIELPPLPFDQVPRDLFVPTAFMRSTLQPAELERPGEDEAADAIGMEPFEARHVLQGVLTGRVPLALIDGQLFRRGAELDGYRLVELREDCVVFEQDGRRVKLRVPQRTIEGTDLPAQPGPPN